MIFDRIIGQYRPKEILSKAIENNRVAHAYLFHGPAGVGKEALAIEFAKALYCKSASKPCNTCSNCKRVGSFEHPDFIYIFPAPKAVTVEEERQILNSLTQNPYDRKQLWAAPTVSIDKIRDLRKKSVLKPMEGLRVVIITDAETMSVEAANSLLKILEEPPEFMHLVLITSKVNALLQTIISRCQEVKFSALTDMEIEKALINFDHAEPEKAVIISRMSQGSYGRALEWLSEDIELRREIAIEFLRVCRKTPMAQLELVEMLMQKYDKKVIKDILGLLLIWFRDALFLSEKNSTETLVNQDKLDTLEKFTGAYTNIDFDRIFNTIENSINLIDRNVQLNILLFVLMTDIRDCLKTAS